MLYTVYKCKVNGLAAFFGQKIWLVSETGPLYSKGALYSFLAMVFP